MTTSCAGFTRPRALSVRAGLVATAAFAAVVALAGPSSSAPAKAKGAASPSTRATSYSHPDLTGVWELPEGGARTFDVKATSSTERPPFKPEWEAEYKITRERVKAGMKVWDPDIHCLPPGMPRTMNMSYPFEMVESKGRLTMLTEYFNEVRRIYTDGRKHPGPDDLEPTFSGHSIGHWEGDTLVIDTVGLRHDTVIDLAMVPHSDQIHITERVRRIKPDELQWQVTLNDPVVFNKPWTTTKTFVRSPPGSEIREYVCADNNQADKYTPSPDDAKYDHPDARLKTQP